MQVGVTNLYARLGRLADAFEQLERAYQRRDKFLALRLRLEPFSSLAVTRATIACFES